MSVWSQLVDGKQLIRPPLLDFSFINVISNFTLVLKIETIIRVRMLD